MKADSYWKLFMETGAPEMYLMYTQALKTEDNNVFDDPGYRPQSNGLQ